MVCSREKKLNFRAEICAWRSAVWRNFDRLEGLEFGEKFEINLEEGCIRSKRCSLDFGYQQTVCFGTEGNLGKPWSNWSVAGPSGCTLTSSQQTGVRILTAALTCAVGLFVRSFKFYCRHLHCSVEWITNRLNHSEIFMYISKRTQTFVTQPVTVFSKFVLFYFVLYFFVCVRWG